MRKRDKMINMKRVNQLFEVRNNKDKLIDEIECEGCKSNEITDEDEIQWFSDVDGKLFTDKIEP